jgi:hypothetical protein
MKTITWPQLWPEQKLVATEAAHSRAAEALRQAELALERIDQPSALCVALKAEIVAEGRRFLAADTREEMDLIDSRRGRLYEALCNEEIKHDVTQPERWDALEKEIALLTDALRKTREELAYVKLRVEMASNSNAPGPIHVYGTLSEAARAICPVRMEKNQLGETYAQVAGARIRITSDASLTSLPPSSLSWVLDSEPCHAFLPPAPTEILARVVYIEEDDEILVRASADVRVPVSPQLSGYPDVSYVQVFGSLDSALRPYVDSLRALASMDISDEKPLPLLGEVVRDACRKLAVETAGHPKFLPGQRRLHEGQIAELIGVYWQALIDAPWEASIAGSYALLKHRCARGETPNVFACEIQGHFGFRVRTSDHDWITGEVYCPPEHFSPAKFPEQEVVNRPMGQDWVAELGPVKFLIRGKTSRS